MSSLTVFKQKRVISPWTLFGLGEGRKSAFSIFWFQLVWGQLELDMKQQTGSRLGKEYVKAAYCHLAYYLTYMQSTLESLSYSTL